MRIYLSGPMTGHPNFNFPAFEDASERLRNLGHEVMSPHEHDLALHPELEFSTGYATGDPAGCPTFSLPKAFRWDIEQILSADAIVLLPGWESSAGSKFERLVAEKCGVLVMLYEQVDTDHPALGVITADPDQRRILALVDMPYENELRALASIEPIPAPMWGRGEYANVEYRFCVEGMCLNRPSYHGADGRPRCGDHA